MIEQVEKYLRQIEAAGSQLEKEKIGAELQAFYQTFSEGEYEYVKQTLLAPRLNELKLRMAELDEAIETAFAQPIEK